jgi:hypothetical protein
VGEHCSGSGDDRKVVSRTTKYRLADKLNALDKLMRHLGMYRDELNANTGDFAEQLIAARTRLKKLRDARTEARSASAACPATGASVPGRTNLAARRP